MDSKAEPPGITLDQESSPAEEVSAPLITVVIASYNYGQFIGRAIESVLAQTYRAVELVIVDDGSTDNTRSIVAGYPSVIYRYQPNRGVSASRNAGISLARGEYLCFLDADDWLEPNGLSRNYQAIRDHPELAFVSGTYCLLHAETNQLEMVLAPEPENHYLQLLRCNYIGMLAAVLFRKKVLNDFPFDVSVRACEDYDLFLRIARRFPVKHHQEIIATYFHHTGSLSHDYSLMRDSVYSVIENQKNVLENDGERGAFLEGLKQSAEYEDLLKEPG